MKEHSEKSSPEAQMSEKIPEKEQRNINPADYKKLQ